MYNNTNTMRRVRPGFSLIWKMILMLALNCLVFRPVHAQWGIGVKVPHAKLHVHGGSVLSTIPTLPPESSPFYAPLFSDDDSVHHAFKWMHAKSAIRFLGKGKYSIGLDTLNAGMFSMASGFDSFAPGMGSSTFGLRASTPGIGAFASGFNVIAGQNFSFAQGFFTIADGPNTISMGTNLGNNYQKGSFIFGHAVATAENTADNQLKMLFDGGYELYSNATLTIGTILSPGNNAWTVISDVRKKENFLPVRGANFLKRISRMRITSWNYKDQDPKIFRHYGPMAQEFFKEFGADAHGTIGTDTTINQADLDGATLVAIQELIRVTDDLEKINADLDAEVARLRVRLSAINRQKIRFRRTFAKR